MQVVPYLNFDGNCEAAFKFYERVLKGKIESMFTYAGTPGEQQVPAEWRNKVMHVRLNIGDALLMGSDAPPGRFDRPQGFSVTLQMKDTAEAERVFKALSEKATVHMPLAETFWAARFAMLVDQFGIPWMINCGPAG